MQPPQTIGRPTVPGPRLLRGIRRDAHREDRQVQRFEVVEVADEAVGDEAADAAVSRDAEQQVAGDRGARESRPSRRR